MLNDRSYSIAGTSMVHGPVFVYLLGGVLHSLHEIIRRHSTVYDKYKVLAIIAGAFLLIALAMQINLSHKQEELMNRHTRLVKEAEIQMKSALPIPSIDTHVFSAGFLLTAPYFAPTASVWYEQPSLSGGTLQSLKKYNRATNDFFLFDYDDGSLYKLLPELQEMPGWGTYCVSLAS